MPIVHVSPSKPTVIWGMSDYTDYVICYQAQTYNVFDAQAKDAAK